MSDEANRSLGCEDDNARNWIYLERKYPNDHPMELRKERDVYARMITPAQSLQVVVPIIIRDAEVLP